MTIQDQEVLVTQFQLDDIEPLIKQWIKDTKMMIFTKSFTYHYTNTDTLTYFDYITLTKWLKSEKKVVVDKRTTMEFIHTFL